MSYGIKDLKTLITSLTTAEKRHFTLLSRAFSATPNALSYVQLFNHLNMPGTQLSEQGLPPEYSTVKDRLLKNILKSLRLFHQEKSVEIQIQNYLADIEILYSRSLPEQSAYLMRKAYRLAKTYEKFGYLLNILEWEKKVNIVVAHPTRPIEAIADEEKVVLHRLSQVIFLENIYSKAKNMKKLYGNIKGKVLEELDVEILNPMLSIRYEDCTSQKARFYYNLIYALYYWMRFEYTRAYTYSKALIAPKMQIILPGDYLDGILEHATICLNNGNFDEVLNILQFAEQSITEQKLNYLPAFYRKLYFYTHGYKTVIYNYTGNRTKLEESVAKVEEGITLYGDTMPVEALHVTNANLLNAYLGLGNDQKIDELWDLLFQKTWKNVRRDIYDGLYLFRLFRLLQQKLYAVIPSFALSASRYYKNMRDDAVRFDPEIKITNILIKEHDYEDERVRQNILQEIKGIIEAYITELDGANNFQEHYTLYVIWADSILKACSFHEAAAQWYQSYQAFRHKKF